MMEGKADRGDLRDFGGQSVLPFGSLYDPEVPYNALPPLPPASAIETVPTLKQAIAASRAVAELKGVGGLIPNLGMLIRAVVLQEAKLSSEIENIVTTNDKLYRAFSELTQHGDPNTKEVLHYEEALWHGYNALKAGRPLSASLFIEIVQIIREVGVSIRTLPGTQIVNERTKAVVYTPPVGEQLIRELLDNLSNFLHANDHIDPLIKLAVAHYQFEAIHPFSDGNGRTGRVLNILYLVEQGLLDIPVLYLSRYIIENKSGYYGGLQKVTEEGAWEEWIVYMLEAIEVTAIATRQRIIDIRQALDNAIDYARENLRRGYRKEIVELIFEQPYTRIQFFERSGLAKRQAASEHLKELERIGLVKGYKVGREMLYVNTQLMDILSR